MKRLARWNADEILVAPTTCYLQCGRYLRGSTAYSGIHERDQTEPLERRRNCSGTIQRRSALDRVSKRQLWIAPLPFLSSFRQLNDKTLSRRLAKICIRRAY